MDNINADTATQAIRDRLLTLATTTVLRNLPTLQRAGRTLTLKEIEFIRIFTPVLLAKDPSLSIAEVSKFFNVKRPTFIRHAGDLKGLFAVSIQKSSPMKKLVDYKPSKDNKKLNLIKRIFIDKKQEKIACMACGLDKHLEHAFLELAEVDHINGIRKDNRLSNLRVLCPNCHVMCLTSSSSLKTPNVDVEKSDIKTTNFFNSQSQLLQNKVKKRRIDTQMGLCSKPYFATAIKDLFRLYSNDERPKKTSRLVDRLVVEKLKGEGCEGCNATQWRKLPIGFFLQGHHKDENPLNNNVENIEILCANCHCLRHCQGIPLPGIFKQGICDLSDPVIQRVKKALGPVLKRHDMRALARELGISLERLERIGRTCFPELWFPATEKRSVRDFLTVEGREAIPRCLKMLIKCNWRYDQTRTLLRQDLTTGVREPLFVFIYKRFSKYWKAKQYILDPNLLDPDTDSNS